MSNLEKIVVADKATIGLDVYSVESEVSPMNDPRLNSLQEISFKTVLTIWKLWFWQN